MKAQARLYLDIARENIQASTNLIRDGHLEIAASRAYDAMFYTAEALLAEEGKAFSSHDVVFGAFGHLFAKTGRLDAKFYRYLIDAYHERQAANAETLANQAKEFLEAAEALLGE